MDSEIRMVHRDRMLQFMNNTLLLLNNRIMFDFIFIDCRRCDSTEKSIPQR